VELYPERPESSKSVESAKLQPGEWTLRRRLGWTWDGNPNHVAGAHSKRRRGLERRYERAEKMRLHLVAAIRGELVERPEDRELESWGNQLATLTPAVVGGLYDPASVGPGGGRRSWWYLPDVAHEAAALVVRLVRRVMKALRYLGRRRLVEKVRASIAHLGRALTVGRVPHTVPPQTPEEKLKVENSSKPTRIQEELQAVIERARAKQPPERRPAVQEAL
jgi:hypothetical protein